MNPKHLRPTIAFIAVNSSWTQSNLAFYYFRELMRALPYTVRMMEFTLKDHQTDALAEIARQAPGIVCFSAYIWNGEYLNKLIPDLRKLLPDSVFVFGGPELPSLEEAIGSDRKTICIEGPGEAAFLEQAERGFESDGGHVARPGIPLRELPFPYKPSDRARLAGKLVYYETSRGCPFSCAYCLSAEDQRHETRFDPSDLKDLNRLHRELDLLVDLKPKTVKFVDRSFNIHRELARAVWKHVIGLDCECDFHFEIYPDLLTEDDVALLEAAPAGRIRFEIGIQSTEDAINLASGRHSAWSRGKAMLQAILERTNIRVHADLMLGLPAQTSASVLRSLDSLASLFPHEIQLGILKVLPGTPMREIASERGFIWQESPPYQVLKTDLISFAELTRLEALARVVNLYWNKGEFARQWRSLIPKHKPVKLFSALLKHHLKHDLPLHSMAKAKREKVFFDVLGHLINPENPIQPV